MRFLVIGAAAAAATAGGGYYAVGRTGVDIERTVSRPPADVYEGFHLVLSDYGQGMDSIASFDGPSSGSSEDHVKISVKDEPNRAIDYTLSQASQPFLHINVRFEPLDGGSRTKLLANVEVRELPKGVGGKMPIPGLGNAAFKLAVNRVMDRLIRSIEKGELSGVADQIAAERARFETNPELQRYRREVAQSRAAAPMLDPEAERVHPVGISPTPTSSYGR
jgi:hypothetical protein